MPENYFDEPIAAVYDELSTEMFAPAVVGPAVDFLAALAGDGAALEFSVGTGRIALPLSERGVPVHGIDLSQAMLARLRAKPGAERIGITQGDNATTRVDGRFRVVHLVWNGISNLTTMDAQVACFQNAAAHLEPGGCFVIEVGVPDLQRLPRGEKVRPFAVDDEHHLGFDEYDVVNHGLISHHWWLIDGRWVQMSMPFRYAWPAELDLMARIAGMRLRERWANWNREPFDALSTNHVSVWEKLG